MTAEFPLAVHALVYLLHMGCTVSSHSLAENICTNPARVRKVMSKLHTAGLVESSRGKGSGYIAKQDCGMLSLDTVLAALSEEAIDISWHSGGIDMDCLVASGMGDIMDSVYSRMNFACREVLSKITIGQINENIFNKGV